jgi:hypothetical protein
MGQHTTTKTKFTGAMILGALTAGALATGGLASAPTANATCASFFGIGNSANCTSNITSIAIAIGTNAVAHADGLFGAAFSIGTKAQADTYDTSDPKVNNAFDFAVAAGNNAGAVASGIFAIAAQLGQNGTAGTLPANELGFGGNIAISVTPGNPYASFTNASGIGNIAVNLFGNSTTAVPDTEIDAQGFFNIAGVLGGANNLVDAGGTGAAAGFGNVAFNVVGSGNTVKAAPGPFAVAGSIFQNGQSGPNAITKTGPGFNINGIRVFGAAAVKPKITAPSATAVRPGNKAAAPAAAAHTPTQKTAPGPHSRA